MFRYQYLIAICLPGFCKSQDLATWFSTTKSTIGNVYHAMHDIALTFLNQNFDLSHTSIN